MQQIFQFSTFLLSLTKNNSDLFTGEKFPLVNFFFNWEFSQDFKKWWFSTALALIFASVLEVHSYVDYEDKLRELELFSWEKRRLLGRLWGIFSNWRGPASEQERNFLQGHVVTEKGFEWL